MRFLAWFALLVMVVAAPLSAHPHVWADVQAEVTINGGYVEGVWARWTFDEVFTQLILTDHEDGDGKLTPREVASVKKGYFDNLKGYRFFTHLSLGSRSLDVPEPQKFDASITGTGRMVFRFFLPLGIRLNERTSFALAFYDDTFFTDMVFEKTPVKLSASGGKASSILKKDPSRTYYGGQVVPTFAVITWSPP